MDNGAAFLCSINTPSGLWFTGIKSDQAELLGGYPDLFFPSFLAAVPVQQDACRIRRTSPCSCQWRNQWQGFARGCIAD